MFSLFQQISNENQDLLTGLADEEKTETVSAVPTKIEVSKEELSPSEKSDPVKPVSSPPDPHTVLENGSSPHSSVDTSPNTGQQQKPSPRGGMFRMRSSFDRDDGEGDGAERVVSPRPLPQVTTPTSFTVRSSRPSSQSGTKANDDQPEKPVERINFAAARSMFESGDKTKSQSPQNKVQRSAPVLTSTDVTQPKSTPQTQATRPLSNDNVSSSSTTSPKWSSATVVLSANTQHNGQISSQKGPNGAHTNGSILKSNRSAVLTDNPASSYGQDKVGKAKVPQPKTWHQTVRDMGNQSCTSKYSIAYTIYKPSLINPPNVEALILIMGRKVPNIGVRLTI